MNNRQQEFLDLYMKYRLQGQREFYESREKEFSTANEQVITWKAVLIGLTALVSFLTTLAIAQTVQKSLSILAVALPALATALAAYDGLYGFDKQAKVYGDAAVKLQRIRGKAPIIRPETTEDCTLALNDFVTATEGILQAELGQWGQLSSQQEQPEAGRD